MFKENRSLVWLFRLGFFVGLLTAVVTVIYLTPVPDLYFASCDRPCHELDWPMICRYRFILESHHSMGAWCGDCPKNLTHCSRPGCIIADGTAKRVFTANRQLPGPSIQVCENDILVVDVVNRLPGQGVTVHWRGQSQRESPYMDGVPMVTQCPVSSYTTFQYKFRAGQAGTHIWHAHTGNEMLDGLFGSLIVRKADRVEEARPLYDKDEKSHVLIISGWGSKILINGVASSKEELRPKLVVTKGLRYRFRIANAGGNGCPMYFHIEDHPVTVISLDGRHIARIKTSAFRITQGERVDFVLEAANSVRSYAVMVESNCTTSSGMATLVYNHTASKGQSDVMIHELEATETTKLLSTITDKECSRSPDEIICLSNLKSTRKLPPSLQKKEADITLYLPFDYIQLAVGSSGIKELRPRMNNITFLFPPSPLLSQSEGSEEAVCGEANSNECHESSICECTHVVSIPLHATVEIVLINQDFSTEEVEHVFHLHGQGFFVTSVTHNVPFKDVSELKKLDAKDLLMKRNLVDPPMKDTISVPRSGAAAIRFKASNPGYWLLHEQSASEWARGLDIVLKVGEREDFPPTPENFPKCGSWVGPEFFLI